MLERFERMPAGLKLFSMAVWLKAPYFRTARPWFQELRPGYARATVRKRWGVTNHIGTVHAIALCNLCEFVGGTLMEVSIRKDMRWIPRGLQIDYVAKAESDVTAICSIDDIEWREKAVVDLPLTVCDAQEQVVARATIPMYVSPRG
ncbi:MAG: hotdog fold domain-containing protein [Pseudomonadota bacterium]